MPEPYPISVTKNLRTWSFQRASVERPTDNATYEAAHPDDTLILVGPARRSVARADRGTPLSLMALGMCQALQVSTQVPVTPVQAIGSGRAFFLRGKSQSSWSLQRCLINGRNMLRALYHNALEAGIRPSEFDDPASIDENPRSQFFINLDSELYHIPIGLAVVIRSKSFSLVASLYLELCLINSYSMGIQAGGNMIAESVTGLCDRILPFQPSETMAVPRDGVRRTTMDAVLGLAPNVFPTGADYDPRVMGSFSDDGLGDGTVPMRF